MVYFLWYYPGVLIRSQNGFKTALGYDRHIKLAEGHTCSDKNRVFVVYYWLGCVFQ